MSETQPQQPWDELHELVAPFDAQKVEGFLEQLPSGETARILSRLSEEDQTALLSTLAPDQAADLVDQLPDAQAVEMLERLEPEVAADIIEELPSDEQADLLGDLAGEEAEAILAVMEPAEAAGARALIIYADDVAGGLMERELLSYPQSFTVDQVIDDLRRNAEKYSDYEVQYAYVVDPEDRLVGVLPMRDLLLARGAQSLDRLMIREPATVRDAATLEELEDFFERYNYRGAPVVDADGRLLGVVQRADLEEALADRADDDYRKSQGIVGGEELRTMPLLLRSRRRLTWLSINIVLNIIAASVIAFYQDTLSAVIALAVFLPIISDMSGCTGAQAIAVSMRELTLGLIKPADALRVWLKEVSVGALNGIALGLLLGGAAIVWKGNPILGLVVGGAMTLNTLVAVSIGGAVPLLLKHLKMDPALASGPILTTITDMCGFFLVLSFAAVMLPWLTTA